MVARGFTLTELMVTLAIFSVLGAVAAPSMHTLVDKQRVSSASTDLFTALMRTRSEAIRRNTEVTLAPASAGWADGWLIPDPANSAVVFETHGAVAGATITGPTRVVYLANGRIKGNSAPAFSLSGRNGVGPRCIKVDLSGRPNQKNTAC